MAKEENECHGGQVELINENEFLMRTISYVNIMVESFSTALKK
jgi:hypothetical protein